LVVDLLSGRSMCPTAALEMRSRAEGAGRPRRRVEGRETRLDGTILVVVCMPMRLQRHGGRKRIVAPDGSQIAA
jgi:hypothetical protein